MKAKRKPRRRFLTGPELRRASSMVYGQTEVSNRGYCRTLSEAEARKMLCAHPDERIYELVPVKLEK